MLGLFYLDVDGSGEIDSHKLAKVLSMALYVCVCVFKIEILDAGGSGGIVSQEIANVALSLSLSLSRSLSLLF
jgi:hypothetical protein